MTEVRVDALGGATAVLAAGEEARATACVSDLVVHGIGGAPRALLSPAPRCVQVPVGPGSTTFALPLPAGTDVRAKVTLVLVAASNRLRTTVAEHEIPALR